MAEDKKLLEIQNLRKYFPIKGVKGPLTGCFPFHQKRRDTGSGRRVRMWENYSWKNHPQTV